MTCTAETREKLRARRLGKKASPETKEKQRQAKLGRKHKPSHNKAISEGMLKAWAKLNPIRVNKLTPELRYFVRKLYSNGMRGEAIREALLLSAPNQLNPPSIG